MPDTVRTRFAPSPTGYLHVGGARTALFNYLLARRHNGRFILRIEDTDQTRNIAAADQKLLDDLRWLGLQWDEGPEVGGDFGPYYQSQRLGTYGEHARRLLDEGRAYYAFDTREELDAMRRAAQQGGQRGFRYPRPTSFPSDADAERARNEGRPVVVRFKMPEQDTVVHDEILGDVTIAAHELSDFVIVKADGWPTYHFAVVVDDAAMQITHVLRGQEHLMNTPNHIALFNALGHTPPKFAHLPIIFTMQGTKMSKREKDKVVRAALKESGREPVELMAAVGVRNELEFNAWQEGEAQLQSDQLRRLAELLDVSLPEIDIHDFRVSGYLPEVIVNFIALLGWSAGDDREKYTLDELCAAFSVDRVGKTNAKFDRDKLLAFNTTAVAEAEPDRLLAAFRDYLSLHPESPLAEVDDATATKVLELCAGFRTFPDVETKCGTLFASDESITYDPAAVKKWLLKGEGAGLRVLRELADELRAVDDWSAERLDTAIRAFAEKRELGLGKVAQPLRVAATGTTISPAIADTLVLLGKERLLARIERVLASVDSTSTM